MTYLNAVAILLLVMSTPLIPLFIAGVRDRQLAAEVRPVPVEHPPTESYHQPRWLMEE